MINYSINIFIILSIKFLFYFNVIIILLSTTLLILNNFYGNSTSLKDKNISNFLKNLLTSNILINLLITVLITYVYIYIYKNMYLLSALNMLKTSNHILYKQEESLFLCNVEIDLFGFIFYALSLIVGFISFLALDTRLYSSKNIFLVLCNVLICIIFLFSYTNNYVLFFILYEALLIPSFFFVYKISPAKTAIQSSIYFVMWTQIGSFLVFLAIVYCISLTNNYTFISLSNFNFTNNEILLIQFLLFFGFGIKIPVWPFHYWITKTHVDAPTGFSIFLSGFLVKTALFGFYKFNMSLGYMNNTVIFSTICFLGVIDASIKMWGQTDLKKLVAYATIQEMGLVYITLCYGDTTAVFGGFLFTVTHAFLSAIFFFLVDTVSRRFYTRNIVEINGILHLTPNLGIMILISCIFFSGLPGTLKFISELFIFSGLVETSPISILIVLFGANFLGLIGFSKVWFNVVFGMTAISKNYILHDLSYKEVYTLLICFLALFLWGLVIPQFM